MMSGTTADQERIEQDLGRTRARMDARLNELQSRLTPGQVLDDLMRYFRGNEGRDFGRSLVDSVRSNPLPAALTGIGLTWLMATSPRSDHGQATPRAGNGRVRVYSTADSGTWASREELDRHISGVEQNVVRGTEESEAVHRARLDEARGMALGVKRQAQDTDKTFAERIQEAVAKARQGVVQGAHDLRDQAGSAAGQLKGAGQSAGSSLASGTQAAQHMSGRLLSSVTDNPVLLGTLGLAVGALLGALLPQSEQEQTALGGMASQARAAARDMTQDMVDRGGQVAQNSLDAGRDSARTHGLTSDKTIGNLVDEGRSGELADNVKQVAQDVLKAGDEAIRRDGLGQGQEAGEAGSSGTSPRGAA